MHRSRSRGPALALLVMALACEPNTAPAPLVAAKLKLVSLGPSIVAGKPIGPGVRVEVLDADGRLITTATNDVTITLATNLATNPPVSATLSGTTTMAAVAGVATFSNLLIDKSASGFALTAAASGLASATSPPFTVQADAPSALAFASPPTSATAGVAIAPAIQVAVYDALGNWATNAAAPVQLQMKDAGGDVVYQASVLPAGGVATFANVVVERAGSYTAFASGASISPVQSDGFSIAPATAARLWFMSQPNVLADAGRPVGTLLVAVHDAFGNVVTSASNAVTISLAENPRSASLSGTLTADAVNGVASFANVMVDRPANGYALGASASGLSGVKSTTFNVRFLFADVSTGGGQDGSHTCAITNAGAAYCWGSNQYGQLGDGTTTPRLRPTLVAGGFTFTAISAGAKHTCGLTTAQNVLCWGDNSETQLGNGSVIPNSPTPVGVGGGHSFTAVSAGYTHNCAIEVDGFVFCWGANPDGRLGDGSPTPHNVPFQVSGSLVFQQIAVDSAHSCGLSGNTAYCWGANSFGQLGDGTQVSKPTPTPVSGGLSFGIIATGARHTCAVEATGASYYCWGNNSHQQTALADRTTPVVAPVQGWPTFLSQFSGFTAGSDFNCIVAVFVNQPAALPGCWGNNSNGQLGNVFYDDAAGPGSLALIQYAPTRMDAGKAHSCLVSPQATLLCWGDNSSGQLGDGTTTMRSVPQVVTP